MDLNHSTRKEDEVDGFYKTQGGERILKGIGLGKQRIMSGKKGILSGAGENKPREFFGLRDREDTE